jgi:RNAse (barnase) inhibitor barstar
MQLSGDTNLEASFQDLDRQILMNGAISLFFSLDVLQKAIEWFQKHHYLVYILDCTNWLSEKDLHHSISKTMKLPDYYGKGSLDGLSDVLIDIDMPNGGGVAIVFLRFNVFAANVAPVAQALLDILERTSRLFLLDNHKLISLIQSDDPNISFASVGCSPVLWNPKEWINQNRGL